MIDYQKPLDCKLCKKKFGSLHGLNTHVVASHKDIASLDYYVKYMELNSDGRCKFCGNPAQFKGFTKGFLNICLNQSCVKKSFAPFSKEYKIKIDGLTEDEYTDWTKENSRIKKKKTEESFAQKREEDPDFDKKNSRYCKEFWIEKGFSLDESIIFSYNETQKNRDKFKKILTDDPNYMKGKSWVSEEYWINKGYSKEEAKKIVSEKQSTFSLEKCIEKHGEEEGRKKWKERQEKWMKTLDDKTDEEKLEILKKKVFSNKKYSEISQKLFFSVLDGSKLDKNKCFFALCNEEKDVCDNIDVFKPDFLYEDKVIEFFGDYWHANPNLFSDPNKKIRRGTKKYSAESIRKIDEYRLNFFRKNNYKVLVIWENDYRKNENEVLKRCIDFLN